MTAIDSRAVVTCSLGDVIQGGISDSYLQNAGLITTRGQVTIKGASTPDVGTEVTISFNEGGGAQKIKRNLQVLSAFADPFKDITEVSIGCPLTYAAGMQPAPSVDGKAAFVSNRQLECLNGLDKSAFPPPIMAQDVFDYCISKLPFSGTATLENAYVMDEYDLSGGYVAAIGNLLLSESKCGYIDESGSLEVINLARVPAQTEQLTPNNIISISGVNSGELAPSIVLVPYIDKKLEDYEPDDAKWDEAETVETMVTQRIDYDGGFAISTHIPTVRSVTEYGDPIDLTDQCDLYEGGFGDLSNSVVGRTNSRTTSLGVSSPGYASALFSAGFTPATDRVGTLETVETTSYDEKNRPILIQTLEYEPMFVYAGRLSLPWVIGESAVDLGNEAVLVQKTEVNIEYAGEAEVPTGLKAGQDPSEWQVYERRVKRVYQASGRTQGGSQGTAEATTAEAFASTDAVITHINATAALVLVDVQLDSQKRYDPKGQQRPGESDRGVQAGTLDGGGRTVKFAELQFSNAGGGDRLVQYRPPHLPESYFNSAGDVVEQNTQAIAATFGRVQHRLALGNRLGMNIQALASALNLAPYTGFSVQAQGYSGLFCTNSLSFTFSRDGIVASVDAAYIGAQGTSPIRRSTRSTTPWTYLPQGYDISKLPAASEGQVILPFDEKANVAAGIALGVKVHPESANFLPPKTVELGVKVGVDGTNGTVREIVHLGVAAGLDVISTLGVAQQASVGVKVGTNVEASTMTATTAEVGVKIGVNLGPELEFPWLLMNFDSDFSDQSPNGFVFADVNSTPYPDIHPSGSPASRFGDGCMVRPYSRGSKVLDLGTGVEFGKTWTIEFWIYLTSDSVQYAGVDTFLSFKGDGVGWDIDFANQNAGDPAWFEFYEPTNPRISNPTGPKIPLDEWVHLAVVAEKDGGQFGDALRLYQNGIRLVDNYLMNDTNLITHVCIGNQFRWSDKTVRYQYWQGFMDELRVTRDKAIYTGSSFTPPTGPF